MFAILLPKKRRGLLTSHPHTEKIISIPFDCSHQIRLPVVGLQTLINAPPKVLLALSPPRVDRDARLGQGCGHLVLGGEDVARGPTDLRGRRSFGVKTFLRNDVSPRYLCSQLDQGLNHDGRHCVDMRAANNLKRINPPVVKNKLSPYTQ